MFYGSDGRCVELKYKFVIVGIILLSVLTPTIAAGALN